MPENSTKEMAGSLSDNVFWEEKWSARKARRGVGFDRNQMHFRDLHSLFQRTLPVDPGFRFLEVGCFPGNYMWYFNRYFQYQVSGIEYVESCSDLAREYLAQAGVKSEVLHVDFFEYQVAPEDRFDVVASVGFIEHFTDYAEVLQRQAALLKDGGYLVVVIPNHQGFYGEILARVDPKGFATHNRMSLDDLGAALADIDELSLIEQGYYGHIGFWNCGLYERVASMGRFPYVLIRSPLWCVEKIGRFLPNSAKWSPMIAAILRKKGSTDVYKESGNVME